MSMCLVPLKWLFPFEEILRKGQCRWERSLLHLSHVLSGLGSACFFLIGPPLVYCFCLWVGFYPSLCSSTALFFTCHLPFLLITTMSCDHLFRLSHCSHGSREIYKTKIAEPQKTKIEKKIVTQAAQGEGGARSLDAVSASFHFQ